MNLWMFLTPDTDSCAKGEFLDGGSGPRHWVNYMAIHDIITHSLANYMTIHDNVIKPLMCEGNSLCFQAFP